MIDWILKRSAYLKQLETELKNNSLKIATLEGAYLVKSQSQKSQSQNSLNKSQSNFETRLIQKIRKSKKSLVMAEIIKLIDLYSTSDIFNKIVTEKGLCSKASFYRYLDSLKSVSKVSQIEITETKLRQN